VDNAPRLVLEEGDNLAGSFSLDVDVGWARGLHGAVVD
jgi:hypothetical protein